MKRAALLALLALAFAPAPLRAAGDLDGTAWTLKWGGLFGKRDRLAFEGGEVASRATEGAGGAPAPYDSRREGVAIIWTAEEPYGPGRRIWQGIWDGRSRVMEGTVSYPDAEGAILTREWSARQTLGSTRR